MTQAITLILPDEVHEALTRAAGLAFQPQDSFILAALVRELRRRGYGLGKMTPAEKRWIGIEGYPEQ